MKQLFILCVGAVLLASCDNKQKTVSALAGTMVDTLPGQCPYLTKDAKGNTILSWVRMTSDSSAAFCYAVYRKGKTFGTPVVIPKSNNIQPHGENLPKIIFKPSGEIIALWGAASTNLKNKYAGMVFYAQSFDEGKTWSEPRPLVSDTAGYDQRYYDVALLPNGEAGIIWLDNRKTAGHEGSALYFASTTGRNGFQHERRIAESCCQCCRTDLFVDVKGCIHTLYRSIINDSIRDMVHTVSVDGGKTFSSPQRISNDNWVISGCPHTGPAMTESKDGLHFAWFTGGKDKGCFYTSSKNNGESFSSREAVSESGSHPQLAAFPDDNVVVVWDEPVREGNKMYQRIGMQTRNGNRSNESHYITADTATASYPVVTTAGERASLVAYSEKRGSKNYIAYQVVEMNR